MVTIMDTVFQTIDSRVNEIETNGMRAAVIVINEGLFKKMQQEMLTMDMSQSYGKIRSPYALQVYRGIKVIPSQVVEQVEVL